MDVARTARRLGAEDALVVYRRTQAQMPADAVEVEEAIARAAPSSWNLRELSEGNASMEQADTQLRADVVALWARWALRHLPQDVGEERGWDESYLEEWLAQVREAVRRDDDIRFSTHKIVPRR